MGELPIRRLPPTLTVSSTPVTATAVIPRRGCCRRSVSPLQRFAPLLLSLGGRCCCRLRVRLLPSSPVRPAAAPSVIVQPRNMVAAPNFRRDSPDSPPNSPETNPKDKIEYGIWKVMEDGRSWKLAFHFMRGRAWACTKNFYEAFGLNHVICGVGLKLVKERNLDGPTFLKFNKDIWTLIRIDLAQKVKFFSRQKKQGRKIFKCTNDGPFKNTIKR